jgi:predicted nucleotidyltransferase
MGRAERHVTHPLVAARQAERAALLDTARRWAEDLDPALGVERAVVFGSVARGDFNRWSDIDVLVVARHLPDRWVDRLEVLGRSAPAGLSPVGWTPSELDDMRRRRNPIAVEADEAGVVVLGS